MLTDVGAQVFREDSPVGMGSDGKLCQPGNYGFTEMFEGTWDQKPTRRAQTRMENVL